MKILNSLESLEAQGLMHRSIYYGDQIFTTILLKSGTLYFTDKHFSNLKRTLWEVYGYSLSVSDFENLLEKVSKTEDSRVRLCFSLSDKSMKTKDQKLVAWITQSSLSQPKSYVSLQTCEASPKINSYKWASYGEQLSTLRKIKEDDYLGVYRGEVLEASTSNIFFISGETLVTPKDGIYKGVIRSMLIENSGKDVCERRIMESELAKFDGAFLTNSIGLITPISKINNIEYNTEKSETIRNQFLVENEL